jgi:hypothetical protein
VTPHYSAIATMKHFGMCPAEWRALSRFDKLLFTYQRTMESYYEWKAAEKMKEEAARQKRKADMMRNMPALRRR